MGDFGSGKRQISFHDVFSFPLRLQTLRGLRNQRGGDVNVEVDSAPGADLKQRLDQLRAEYERIIAENRREVEQWYESKASGLSSD